MENLTNTTVFVLCVSSLFFLWKMYKHLPNEENFFDPLNKYKYLGYMVCLLSIITVLIINF